MLTPGAALAASDTWTGLVNSSYNTAGNWLGGSVPNGTNQVATFPSGAIATTISMPASVISVDRFIFNADSPSYTFALPARSDLRLYGGGLINNSPVANYFNIGGGSTYSYLRFYNSASAGSGSEITNNSYGRIYFYNSSNAGNVRIFNNSGGQTIFQNSADANLANITTNSGGYVYFYNSSSAGQANFTTNSGGYVIFRETSNANQANFNNNGRLYFYNDATAAQSSISNNPSSVTYFFNNSKGAHSNISVTGNAASTSTVSFNDTSTAEQAHITVNNRGNLYFNGSASAGQADLTANSGGRLYFRTNATAAQASVTVNPGSSVYFYNTAKGGAAQVTVTGDATATSSVSFNDTSTAEQAHITVNDRGNLYFNGSASAGQADLTVNSGGRLYFRTNASAGQASITGNSGSYLYFQNNATAAQASITVNPGSVVYFQNTASGGLARLWTEPGGLVDFSGLSSAGTTVGSIAGGGNFLLGNKWLETGSDDTDTEVSGVISGAGGSLRKAGEGTLTLSGANTYTGTTLVNSGCLRLTGTLNSSISVASGGELSGTGSTSGNLILSPGALYSVTISPFTSGSRVGLQVGGNVSLNDNLLQYNFLSPPTKYVPQYRYDLLTYGGTASGNFVLPTSTNIFYTQNVVHDEALRRYILLVGWKPLSSVVHSTANQLAVARALDRAWQAGCLPEIIQPLLQLTAPQVQSALSQLSGSQYSTSLRAVGTNIFDFKEGIKARIHGFGEGIQQITPLGAMAPFSWSVSRAKNREFEPGYFQGPGFSWNNASPSVALPLALGGPYSSFTLKAREESRLETESSSSNGVWGSAILQENHLEGSSSLGVSGANWRTRGFQAGFDRTLGQVRLGFSLGYYDTLGNFTESIAYWRTSGGIGAFYGQYQGRWRHWYLDLGVGYGIFNNYMRRHLTFLTPDTMTVQGNYKSHLVLGFLETGFELFRKGPLRLQSFTGFLLADLQTSSFKEKGRHPYKLSFSPDTFCWRQAQVGGRLSFRRASGRWPWELQVEAAWQHEFANPDTPLVSGFASNPTFKFPSFGSPCATDSLWLSGAGSLYLGWGTEIFGRATYSYDHRQNSLSVVTGLQKRW